MKRETMIKLAVEAGFTKQIEEGYAFILADVTNLNLTYDLEKFADLVIDMCAIKAVEVWEEYGADGQEIAATLRGLK